MKITVIQILCHTLVNDENLTYHVNGNWATRQARSLLKYSKHINCEVWYGVRGITEVQTFKKEGITFKLFPAKTVWGLLESFYGIISCPDLIHELQNYDKKNTIVNFQGERGSLIHTIIRKYPDYIFSIQYHGYGQPHWLDWFEKLVLTSLEKKTFPLVSHFFIHIKRRYAYLTQSVGIPKEKISFQNYGVDYERFIPGNKKEARKKLGIPQNKFIMMYVGLMTPTKGVDKVIEAYRLLKPRYPQLYLLLIGAQKADPLLKLAKSTADKLLNIVKNEELPLYYQAADVYVFFGNRKTIEYAGTGTAPVEALVCNTNVISTNLVHYPNELMDKTGFIPKNFDDFVSKIEYCINNPNFKFNARELVKQYSSDQNKANNILKIYDNLVKKKGITN